jgi:integrase/recombinase XerD
LTTADLRAFLNRWADRSASTRSNVISVVHSFFDWANVEGLVDADPSTKIRRPRKRRPDIYRPSLEELQRIRDAALPHELPAILLMEGAGLRNAEVIACRWADIDLARGRAARVFRKGQNWHWLPIDPDVADALRASFGVLRPDPDDHVFTVEVEQWVSQFKRVRRRKNPKARASGQALWRMVARVCERAGVRVVSPHQLRHGFANRFMRESGRDVGALRGLMGHSRIDTTQLYTGEIELDELAEALDPAAANRMSQASPDPTTLEAELTDELERLRWRRRESNPRKISIGRVFSGTFHIHERHIAPPFERPKLAARSPEPGTLVHAERPLVELSDIEHDAPSSKAGLCELETQIDERSSQSPAGQIRT